MQLNDSFNCLEILTVKNKNSFIIKIQLKVCSSLASEVRKQKQFVLLAVL